MKHNQGICPYCGHVFIDDNQEYCDYCGMDIEKDEVTNKKDSGSCLGSIGTVLFVILLIILLVSRK